MTSNQATYHLHLETQHGRPVHLAPTEAAWHAAANRHPELARLIRITAGTDADIRDEALKTADFTIDSTPPRERLRERAPRLKWIQTTGAGLDPILPLDWLPPGVTLTNNRGAHGRKAEDSVTLALLALHVRLPALVEQQREQGVERNTQRAHRRTVQRWCSVSATLARQPGVPRTSWVCA